MSIPKFEICPGFIFRMPTSYYERIISLKFFMPKFRISEPCLKSNPFRLLFESGGQVYTWLKYKNRVGPITVADNPVDKGNTPMGNSTHWMADWQPWEKRLLIDNELASSSIGGPMLFTQEGLPQTTWRTFTMNYTTEKISTTKHCYSHVYVPENTTYDQV